MNVGLGMMSRYAVCAALVLGGCASVYNAGSVAPAASWVTSNALDPSVACVVQQMSAAFPRWPFGASIVVPGSVYEVRPQIVVVVGGDPLLVRLSKQSDQTKIELFGAGALGKQANPYVAKCA